MRLVLLDIGRWYSEEYTFFEHQDPHAAVYEIFSKVEAATKDIPKVLTDQEVNGKYTDLFYGDREFNFRGLRLRYSDYLNLIPLPGKNPLFPPKNQTYNFTIIEATVITFEDYFERVRTGKRWTTERKSILKNEYTESDD
jgi:hypothetical protein